MIDKNDSDKNKPDGYTRVANRASRRLRVNKKKFARSIILLGCVIAAVAAVFYFTNSSAPALAQGPQISQPEQTAASAQGGSTAGKVIVLDAGHGGFDIGATGVSGVHESDLNLKVANDLKADLEGSGDRVIMTRQDENAVGATKDEDMAARRKIIQDSGEDIVVSVHMNSDTKPSASGPTVLFMTNSIEGEKLARSIQTRLIKTLHPQTQNSARAESFYILESGTQPIVIVECGFLSNAEEEGLLTKDGYQQNIAKAITEGCNDYFSAK